MPSYNISKEITATVEDAIEKITHTLQTVGFGVLTRINMHEKFKEKLNIDFKKYVILGACNPPNAHKAVEAEVEIGLLLPCNIIVYEKDETTTVVSIIKPTEAMKVVSNRGVDQIAIEIEQKLKQALDAI